MKQKLFTVPNIITLIRIIFLPIFIVAFLNKNFLLTLVLYFFLAISDYFDGLLARKLQQSSKIGSTLDQVADIILLVGVYFCGLLTGVIPWIFFVLIALRIIIVLIKIFISKRIYKTVFSGKFSVLFLMYCAGFFILAALFHGIPYMILTSVAYAIGIWGIYMYYISSIEYVMNK
jgi:cardiolipin synthase